MSWILDTLGGLFHNILGRGQEMGMMKYQQGLQHQTMQKQFGLNSQSMEHQANLNYNQWLKEFNMQNEYNTPAQQLQRIKDAGLNAALMYGRTGVTNSNTMGAGSGVGLGSVSAPGLSSTPSDVGGSILKYQEAKRSPQRDALAKWQAAIEAEKAISLRLQNEEIHSFIKYMDGKQSMFHVAKDGTVIISYNDVKAPKNPDAIALQKTMQIRKQELENLINDIRYQMEQLNIWLKQLGVNPANNDTMLSLASSLKYLGIPPETMTHLLTLANISGSGIKQIMSMIRLGKGKLSIPTKPNFNNNGPTPGGMKPGTWGGNALKKY